MYWAKGILKRTIQTVDQSGFFSFWKQLFSFNELRRIYQGYSEQLNGEPGMHH
jgi:hypothetical protein